MAHSSDEKVTEGGDEHDTRVANDGGSEVLAMEAVLGAAATPHTLHCVDATSVLYVAANVGVIFNTHTRRQTLLRGHRNPVRACAVFTPAADGAQQGRGFGHALPGSTGARFWDDRLPDEKIASYARLGMIPLLDDAPHFTYLLTACAGADNTAIIVWDKRGHALVQVEQPHPQGTQAIDISHDGRYFAALSVPYEVPLPTGDAEAASTSAPAPSVMCQSLTVWQLHRRPGVAPAAVTPEDVHLRQVASSILPIADWQHGVTFNTAVATPAAAAALTAPAGSAGGTLSSTMAALGSDGRDVSGSGGSPTATAAGAAAAVLPCAYELATTGSSSVVFWALRASAIIPSVVSGSPAATLRASRGSLLSRSGANVRGESAGAPRGAGRDEDPALEMPFLANTLAWSLACAPAPVPGVTSLAPAPYLAAKSAAATAGNMGTLGGGVSTGLLNGGGARGGDGGDAVSAYAGAATEAGLSATAAGSTRRFGATSLGAGGGASGAGSSVPASKSCTVTIFMPYRTRSGAATVSAITSTTDGMLLLWTSSVDTSEAPLVSFTRHLTAKRPPESGFGLAAGQVEPALYQLPDMSTTHAVTDQLIVRTTSKTIRLSANVKAELAALGIGTDTSVPGAGGEGDAGAAPQIHRINALRLTPNGRYILVGGEDGGVRAYDEQMRLVAWWDDIGAGGITSLSLVPSLVPTSVALPAHDALASGNVLQPLPSVVTTDATVDAPGPSNSLGLPDFMVATRRSLIIALAASSFESADDEARRGVIMLEGPDAAVVGIAAYPAPYAHLLAVAVASGCVQLWDTSTHQLLVVRELIRPHGFAAGSAAAAAAALQAPQFFIPSAVAVDPYARFLAVGTQQGFLCILDPLTLADAQNAVPPPAPRAAPVTLATLAGSLAAGGSSGANGSGGAGIAAAATSYASLRGAAITRVVFADDGIHCATSDVERHVTLFRFTRTKTRQVSTRTNARLGLGFTGSITGRRHGSEKAGKAAPASRRPRPWELIDGDESGLEEIATDAWTFIGRARSHSDVVTGVLFSPLPHATVSPHVFDLPDGADLRTAFVDPFAAFRGGYEADCFWMPGGAAPSLLSRHAGASICMLMSVGADRRAVMYDVGASSVHTGLLIAHNNTRYTVSQFATPTAAAWYPQGAPPPDTEASPEQAASCFMLADTHFKLKLWSVAGDRYPAAHLAALSSTPGMPVARKTVLAPTFGGSITHLAPIRTDAPPPGSASGTPSAAPVSTPCLAFATDERVLGVIALPLNGNPYAAAGVIAHPGPVTGVAVHAAGTHIFSCGLDAPPAPANARSKEARRLAALAGGSANGTVCIWRFAAPALQWQVSQGGSGLAPFLSLLEGGADGELYQSVCDMFSYAQIRSQGEASTRRRRAGITLPLSEVASVMRALGFYPTAADATAMVNEVKGIAAARHAAAVARGAAAATDAAPGTDQIDLPTLIMLYVNHRPVVPVTRDALQQALHSISVSVQKAEGLSQRQLNVVEFYAAHKAGAASDRGAQRIRWGALARALGLHGERMGSTELTACLTALLGPAEVFREESNMDELDEGVHFDDSEHVTVQDLIGTVLGFAEEGEEAAAAAAAAAADDGTGGAPLSMS